jgi:two-component system, sensor histidine kinase PdtaS
MFSIIRKTSAWPLSLRFACTIAVILVAFAIEFPLEEKGSGTPFTCFITCVCMVAVFFGRPAGFLAVAMSAPLGALFFKPVGSFQLTRAFDLLQIQAYVVLAVIAVLVLEQVRRALILFADTNAELKAESSRKSLQLREVAHRMANNFASLDALIRQRAMASADPKIQLAFEQASNLVHIVARVNSRLNSQVSDTEVDSGSFITGLCEDLQACAQEGVTIECDAEPHELPLAIILPLSLIINEVVTNALKYAFPDKRAGQVAVTFLRARGYYRLVVEDDGVGMSQDIQGSGLGLHLLNGLSQAIRGAVEFSSTSAGTIVALKFEAPVKHEIELQPSSVTLH